MGATDGARSGGKPGRAAGQPNRDKLELRALLQEKVHEFTELRRAADEVDSAEEIATRGLSPAQAEALGLLQRVEEEYDPVVALALVAVDRRTPLEMRVRCNAEVAQYVRPKLKSIEITPDPEGAEALARKQELSEQILDAIIRGQSLKKSQTPRKRPGGPATPPSAGDE